MQKNEINVRPPKAGEYGWITKIHGEYYAEKFGWQEEFEVIVAKIMVEFINEIPSNRQECFIAELDYEPVGCLMLTEKNTNEGQVRVFFVKEETRGKGIGKLLLKALLSKASSTGYETLSLITTDNQIEARALYQKIGFRVIERTPNTTFAKGSYDEVWQMKIKT